MKIDFEGAKIFVCPGATDLRKGVTGLLAIIENEMHLDALSNSIFFFCNKSHKLLKIVLWDKTGFWLAKKRLEMATWPWPNTSQEAREINTEQVEIKILNEKLAVKRAREFAAKTESLKNFMSHSHSFLTMRK